MCVAVPGKVLEIVDVANGIARVDVAGVSRTVNFSLLTGDDEPAPGDYVLVHVGFALSRVEEQEAMRILRLLEELGEDPAGPIEQSEASTVN